MRIGVGICGSIAAYRSVDFVKALVAQGHEVRCFPTRAALEFVASKALETVSGHAVASYDSFGGSHRGTEHIAAARWAEAFVIYGATAHFLGQLAAGLAPDFLTQQLLAFEGRVVIAPAMNPSMWAHAAVRRNVRWLAEQGYCFVGPVHGQVACGETGEGHLAADSDILQSLSPRDPQTFEGGASILRGRRVLISAGPMRTALDPVRYIQNRSSGRMGLELARACRRAGATVTVLLGPVAPAMREAFEGCEVHDYVGSDDYAAALTKLWPAQDVFFSAAAVLDFESVAAPNKIERERLAAHPELVVQLRPVPDLVARAAQSRRPGQAVVAFAAESGSETEILARAAAKLRKKGADALVANPVWEGLGPEAARNQVWVLTEGAAPVLLGPADKSRLAWPILEALAPVFKKTFAPAAGSGERSPGPVLHSGPRSPSLDQ